MDRVLLTDASGRAASFCPHGRLKTSGIAIPLVHHELHEGELFTCYYENTVTNINEMTVIAFNTPIDKEIIFGFRGSVTGIANMYLYENTSIDVGEGTTLSVYNRNRAQSHITSNLSTIEATPVEGSITRLDETQAADANITTTTSLWAKYIGSSLTGVAVEAASARAINEWLLAPSQQYAVVIKTATNDDNVCRITLNWQEESLGVHHS